MVSFTFLNENLRTVLSFIFIYQQTLNVSLERGVSFCVWSSNGRCDVIITDRDAQFPLIFWRCFVFLFPCFLYRNLIGIPSLYHRPTAVLPRSTAAPPRAWLPVATPRSTVCANLMLTARDRSKPAYHILFLVLLAAATWRCYSQQAEDACSSQSAASHTDPMASYRYPRASDRSTGLVRELLSPFPLEEFAENYWERMPLVVRGRWVDRVMVQYVQHGTDNRQAADLVRHMYMVDT